VGMGKCPTPCKKGGKLFMGKCPDPISDIRKVAAPCNALRFYYRDVNTAAGMRMSCLALFVGPTSTKLSKTS